MKPFLNTILSFACCTTAFSQTVELVKTWETDQVFKVPESVIYDASSNSIFVANINGGHDAKDGNGFISKIGIDGKVEKLVWAEGVDSPKGMGIFDGKLYVTDITSVAIFDLKTAKLLKKIEFPEAKFLNDIAIDEKGNCFVSDSFDPKVYVLKNEKPEIWLKNASFKKPNGLYAEKEFLCLIDMDGGQFYKIKYSDKSMEIIAKNVTSGDGIVKLSHNQYLISDWNGKIQWINGTTVTNLVDTREKKINAADICLIEKEQLVIVPTFFGNNIVAYKIKK
jgi:DNA-binding beta-propeller fold protein YncE